MAKKKDKKKAVPGELLVCSNPKARKNYDIEETIECGMVLVGSEVKSMRAKRCDLDGAFASVENMELFLHGMHIGPYEQANQFGHESRRKRKLLAHSHEIERMFGRVSHKGFALVPIRIYFKNGRAKIEIALAKGRRMADNRESIRRELDLKDARDAMLKSH